MRLQLNLRTNPNSVLPFNYEYAISAWIYHTLAKADPAFATWLHNQGYTLEEGKKRFKLFTYSRIQPQRPYTVNPKRGGIVLENGYAQLTLSFLIDEAMQHFVTGIFQEQQLEIQIANARPIQFTVQSIQIEPRPEFRPVLHYRCLSPIFLSKQDEGDKYAQYLSPEQAGYGHYLINNLVNKAKAFNPDHPVIAAHPAGGLSNFQLQSQARSTKLRLRGIDVVAYSFDFLLVAPVELQELGYYAGFGGNTSSLGFGCVEILSKNNNSFS